MIEAKRINEKGVHVRIEETGADILMEFTQIVRSVCKQFPKFMVDKHIHMGKYLASLDNRTSEKGEDAFVAKLNGLREDLEKIEKELEKEN